MPEILTESFCERCGTRYTFESTTPRTGRFGKLKVLSRGLKNYVLSDETSLDEALADARSDEDRQASTEQLDAFHKTFNFCMSCRQYTCPNCWNEIEAKCLSCAPHLGHDVLEAPFRTVEAASHFGGIAAETAGNGHGYEGLGGGLEAPAWPTVDIGRTAQTGSAPTADASDEDGTLARLESLFATAERERSEAAPPPQPTAKAAPEAKPETRPETGPDVRETVEPQAIAAAPVEPPPAAKPTRVEKPVEASVAQAVEAVPPVVAPKAPTPPAVAAASTAPAEAAAATELEMAAEATAATEAELDEEAAPAIEAILREHLEVPGDADLRAMLARTDAEAPPTRPTPAQPILPSAPVPPPAAASVPPQAAAPVAPPLATAAEAIGQPIAEVPSEPAGHRAAAAASQTAAFLARFRTPIPSPGADAAHEVPEPPIEELAAPEAPPAPEPTRAPEPSLPAVAATGPSAGPGVDIVEAPTWHVTLRPTPAAPNGREPESVVAPESPERQPWPAPAPSSPEPSAQPVWAAPAAPAERPAPTAPRPEAPPQWPTPTAPPEWPAAPVWPSPSGRNRHISPVDALWAASSRDVLERPETGVQSCVNCGLSLSSTARFCRRCGASQIQA